MSGQPKQQAKGEPTGRVIVKEKRVPVKVVIGDNPTIDFVPAPKPIEGSVLVIVTNGRYTSSFTYHHPIGATDLGDEAWICTDSREVQELMSRRKDPDAQRIEQARQDWRVAQAVGRGLLTIDKDGELMLGASKHPRKAVLLNAKEAKKKHEGKDGPKPGPILPFISDDADRAAEEALQKFWVSLKEAEGEQFPDTFRTMGGPNWDYPQVSAVRAGYLPATDSDIFNSLVYQVSKMNPAAGTQVRRGVEALPHPPEEGEEELSPDADPE
jgi:hypothetical protein